MKASDCKSALLIAIFLLALTPKFILSQDISLVLMPSKMEYYAPPGDLKFLNGPNEKTYMMSESNNRIWLSLLRIDTNILQNYPNSYPFQIEKIVDLSDLLKGRKHKSKTNLNPQFNCVSKDGRWICLTNNTKEHSEIFLVDFLKNEVRFRKSFQRKKGSIRLGASFENDSLIISEQCTEELKKSDVMTILKSAFSNRKLLYRKWHVLNTKTHFFSTMSESVTKNYIVSDKTDVINENTNYYIRHLNLSLNKIDSTKFNIGGQEITVKKPIIKFSSGDNYNCLKIDPAESTPATNVLPEFHRNFRITYNFYLDTIITNYPIVITSRLSSNYFKSTTDSIFEIKSGRKFPNLTNVKKVFFQETKSEIYSVHKIPKAFIFSDGNFMIAFDFINKFFSRKIPNYFSELKRNTVSNNFEINTRLVKKVPEGSGFYYNVGLFINNQNFAHSVFPAALSDSLRLKKELTEFKNRFLSKCDVSKDGKKIFFIKDRNLICYSGGKKPKWESAESHVSGQLKVSDDQSIILVGKIQSNFDLLNSSNGKKFLSFYIDTTSMDWVMWTPSGYYDCSPGGEKLIGWSVGRGPDSLPSYYPAARFRNRFYRPDLVDTALKYGSEEIALEKLGLLGGKKVKKEMVKNLPPIIRMLSPGMNDFVRDSLVQVDYHLQAGSSPVHTIKVFMDGRPYGEMPPPRGSNSITLKVPPKDCSLGLVAVSASGESELSWSRLIWKGKNPEVQAYRKPDLYLLAIGISRYQKAELQLGLAAKDARDFAAFFEAQAGGLYGKVHLRLLTDSAATRESIQAGLEWLERSSTGRDVSMIFMAGHGENDANNQFYFLPWAANPDQMKSTCVSFYDFKSTITNLPGKVLVFTDACRSGNLFGDLVRRSADADRLAMELSRGNGGAVVFTSSGRNQASLEDPSWGNGAFTKALLEGLKGKADLYQEDYVSVKSLDFFLSRRVRELTDGRQTPQTIIPESISDFPVAVRK